MFEKLTARTIQVVLSRSTSRKIQEELKSLYEETNQDQEERKKKQEARRKKEEERTKKKEARKISRLTQDSHAIEET